MSYDTAKLDEIVLALLHLNAFQDGGATRAWKGFDWDALDRLHARGLIGNPKSTARSVVLGEEGARLGEELFRRHFGAGAPAPAADRAVPTVQIDTPGLRVTEWRFAPGASTGPHRHEYPYVVVPLATGRLAITAPDGAVSISELVTGRSYHRPAGVEHDVRNANAFEFAFVETEIKPAAPGG